MYSLSTDQNGEKASLIRTKNPDQLERVTQENFLRRASVIGGWDTVR